MGQASQITIAIISIKRSYLNCILQVSMDRISDVFGKENIESFLFKAIKP